MALESGMAPNPGESYSLASRLICAQCGREPLIANAARITHGTSEMTIVLRCHGQEETRTFTRSDLTRTQECFKAPEND